MTSNAEKEDLIATIAWKCGVSEERLIGIATDFVECGDYHQDNGENYKSVTHREWKAFWEYFPILTGIPVPEGYNGAPFCDVPFSCSC